MKVLPENTNKNNKDKTESYIVLLSQLFRKLRGHKNTLGAGVSRQVCLSRGATGRAHGCFLENLLEALNKYKKYNQYFINIFGAHELKSKFIKTKKS